MIIDQLVKPQILKNHHRIWNRKKHLLVKIAASGNFLSEENNEVKTIPLCFKESVILWLLAFVSKVIPLKESFPRVVRLNTLV